MKNAENRDLTRVTNLKLVMQQLFNNQMTSRAEIARTLQMSRSTISSLYNELDEQGYIEHLGQGDSSVVGGRKPELVKLNSHYGFVACFNITHAHLHAAFFYLDGEKILYRRKNILDDHNILNLMSAMTADLNEVMEHDDTLHGLLGIGISIHAVVDDGQVIDSPFVKMEGINLKEYFAGEYKVPVIVENEANLAAIFERDFGSQHADWSNLVVLSIHQGLGTGIIANHQLFSGFRGMAGELGRVQVYGKQGQPRRQISRVISEDVLFENLKTASGKPDLDYEQAALICEHPNEAVAQVMDEFAEDMGLLLNNSLMVYGPQKIFISCNLLEYLPTLQERIKQAAEAYQLSVPFEFVHGARYISLLGAAAVVVREVLGLQKLKLHFNWPLLLS